MPSNNCSISIKSPSDDVGSIFSVTESKSCIKSELPDSLIFLSTPSLKNTLKEEKTCDSFIFFCNFLYFFWAFSFSFPGSISTKLSDCLLLSVTSKPPSFSGLSSNSGKYFSDRNDNSYRSLYFLEQDNYITIENVLNLINKLTKK